MKNALWPAALVATFFGGIFVGRAIPAHHFEKFGDVPFVLDTVTGKLCAPFRTLPTDPAVTTGWDSIPPCKR